MEFWNRLLKREGFVKKGAFWARKQGQIFHTSEARLSRFGSGLVVHVGIWMTNQMFRMEDCHTISCHIQCPLGPLIGNPLEFPAFSLEHEMDDSIRQELLEQCFDTIDQRFWSQVNSPSEFWNSVHSPFLDYLIYNLHGLQEFDEYEVASAKVSSRWQHRYTELSNNAERDIEN